MPLSVEKILLISIVAYVRSTWRERMGVEASPPLSSPLPLASISWLAAQDGRCLHPQPLEVHSNGVKYALYSFRLHKSRVHHEREWGGGNRQARGDREGGREGEERKLCFLPPAVESGMRKRKTRRFLRLGRSLFFFFSSSLKKVFLLRRPQTAAASAHRNSPLCVGNGGKKEKGWQKTIST